MNVAARSSPRKSRCQRHTLPSRTTELAPSRQQFSVPYFSHGDTSLIFAAFGGVNLSFAAAQRRVSLASGHPVSLRNCFAPRKTCDTTPVQGCVASNNCEPLCSIYQSKHHMTRMYFSRNATSNELEANISHVRVM